MAAKKPTAPEAPSTPAAKELPSVLKVKSTKGEKIFEVTRKYYETNSDRLTIVE